MVQRCSIGSSEHGKLKELSEGKSMFVSQLFQKDVKLSSPPEQGGAALGNSFFFFFSTEFKPGGQQWLILQLVDLLTHGAV